MGLAVRFIGLRTSWVHDAGQQIRRRHPVGQGMVHLPDERESLIGHAFGEVKLPQRTAAIQRRAGDVPDDLIELPATTGGGHLHPAHVVVQIDRAILQPHRMMQSQRNVNKFVAQRIQQMQPTQKRVPEQIEAEFTVGGVDDCDLERVRVQVRCLAVQQPRPCR